MTLTSRDFVQLRWNLLTFVALILIGGGVVFAALYFTGVEEKTNKRAQSQNRDVRARLARANEEEAEIRQKIGRYRTIDSHGYIGQEHRLEWVERIAQIKTARRLIDIQYELSPQKPLDATILPAGPSAGGLEFVASTMKLQMQLLHEGDLLGFFNDLTGTVQAYLHVRSCDVTRLPRASSERNTSAQLKADCFVEWITLREKK